MYVWGSGEGCKEKDINGVRLACVCVSGVWRYKEKARERENGGGEEV